MRGGAGRDPDENEWVAPLIEEVPTTTPASGVHVSTESEPTNMDSNPEHDCAKSLLTMLPACELADQTRAHLDQLKVSELYAEISTSEDIDHAVDEATWIPSVDDLRYRVANSLVSGAVLMHAGLSYISEAAETKRISQELKDNSRRAAALLVRMVAVITLLVSAEVPSFFSSPPGVLVRMLPFYR